MNRRSAWFIAAFILLVLGAALGLKGGPEEWGAATTSWQRIAAGVQIGYGVAGLIAVVSLWLGHRSTVAAALVWAALLTLTGAIAPVVWGDAPLRVGLWSGLASGIVAAIVVWIVRRAIRAGGLEP